MKLSIPYIDLSSQPIYLPAIMNCGLLSTTSKV